MAKTKNIPDSFDFKEGNKAAEKWTEEEAIKAFETIISEALDKSNDWLCIQEAVIESSSIMPYRTFYYLLNKFSVLQNYKKELNDIILTRINRGALQGDYPPAPAIWRLKQLGESDKVEVQNHNTNINVDLDEEERKAAIERVKKGLDEFKDYEK